MIMKRRIKLLTEELWINRDQANYILFVVDSIDSLLKKEAKAKHKKDMVKFRRDVDKKLARRSARIS